MKTTVIGAYPKISDEHQELRRALHQLDRDEITEHDLALVQDERTRQVIKEIEDTGVDVVNDGQIRWDDLFAPLANPWFGVTRGALERFYDNNTYYRIPVVSAPIATDGKSLVRDFTFAKGVARHEVKAALCGPLTFALLADDSYYSTLRERTLAVADALASELRGLHAAGATLVDLEDPAVVASPDNIALAREAYDLLSRSGVPIALQAYFFPADRVIDALADFPVAQVGIDVRSRPTKALDRLRGLSQTVVLGVVDARNTRVESEREVADLIDAALRSVPADRLWLAPTTGLEYLPHDVAVRKLGVLTAAARAVAGVRV